MQASALGDDGVQTVRYWLYAPGHGASEWDDFYASGAKPPRRVVLIHASWRRRGSFWGKPAPSSRLGTKVSAL